MISLEKLGASKAIISEHIYSNEVQSELERFPSMTIIGLGQGGGRIAAELSRFGFPTYLVNSSKSDMDEHKHLISDDRRILTKSSNFPELEGTDRNAQFGFEIAKENKEIYKKLALSNDVQEADFVWVCVSLGGGTGNGALKVALTYLSKVRENKILPDGKIPLGVICSLPSKDERGSLFRKNALAGVNLLQNMISENKIGSVLVIDNQKMNNYYEKEPLKTYGGTEIDAKSYTNMVVATMLVEVATIPLLEGRAVFDKTEFLSLISTPGWLSLSKLKKNIEDDDNLQELISKLYTENEVLADTSIDNVLNSAIAIMYPTTKNISPKLADDVYAYASQLLNSKINLSISANSSISKLTLYGMAISSTPPKRIAELKQELDEWLKIEKEQEQKKKEITNELGLDEFNDYFSSNSISTRRKNNLSLDDEFDDLFESDDDTQVAAKVTEIDLDNIDF